jgi:hypothetical protein
VRSPAEVRDISLTGLDSIEQFLPQNPHVSRSGNSETHLAVANFDDHDLDVVTEPNRLANPSGYHEHLKLLSIDRKVPARLSSVPVS